MNTQCTPAQLRFHPFGGREAVARFDAGHLSSDGGALLLREANLRVDARHTGHAALSSKAGLRLSDRCGQTPFARRECQIRPLIR